MIPALIILALSGWGALLAGVSLGPRPMMAGFAIGLPLAGWVWRRRELRDSARPRAGWVGRLAVAGLVLIWLPMPLIGLMVAASYANETAWQAFRHIAADLAANPPDAGALMLLGFAAVASFTGGWGAITLGHWLAWPGQEEAGP